MESGGDIPQESQILVGAAVVGPRGLLWGLLELVGREVRRVRDGAQSGDEGGVDQPDGLPVYAVEEGVFLDVLHAQASVG